jgi:hypothetical protein
MNVRKYLAVVLCFGLFVGCTSRRARQADPGTTELEELSELFHASAGATGHAPTKLADLERFHKTFPKAYDSVKSGDVVVLWGTPIKGEGDVGKGEVVLAYEKNVPTEGGYVLMSAGTVKKMSAADFASAPKTKK